MRTQPTPPSLSGLWLPDPPGPWEALGFAVDADASAGVGGVALHLGAPGFAWAIRDLPQRPDQVDGLPTRPATEPSSASPHPNGVTEIDHIVILTPDFDRTATALDSAGMPLRRIRDTGRFRQGFRRLGPAILELVETPDAPEPEGPATFWGITFIASDLEALSADLGERLRTIKPAVQPGRRIATLDRSAGLATNVAFMTPEER